MPVVSIEGHNATWKTGFGYSQPLPIFGFQFDMGFDRASKGTAYDKFFKGLNVKIHTYEEGEAPSKFWDGSEDIVVLEIPQPLQMNGDLRSGYIDAWDYFMAMFGFAVRDKYFNSYVLDTATVARRFKAEAYLEGLQLDAKRENKQPRKQLLQMEWGKPNEAIREIITTAGGIRKNFVLTHWLTEEYVKGFVNNVETTVPSGNYLLEGLSDTHNKVDVALRFDKSMVDGKTIVRYQFKKCGYNTDLENPRLTFDNPTWDSVMKLIDDTQGGRLGFQYRG